jgi:hypothetical protein
MRTTKWTLAVLIASAGAGAAILASPVAAADTHACTNSGDEDSTVGTYTTVCQTPGNFQETATAPTEPDYPYPWDDEFYGSAMILGPNEPMHSFGGYGGGPHR